MTVWYREKYLELCTSFLAVVKTYYNHIDRLWVLDSSSSRAARARLISTIPTHPEPH